MTEGDLFPERIETERLVLEAFTPENVDVMTLYQYASHRNPNVEETTEYLSWDPYRTPEEAHEFLRSQAEARREGESATYVIRPKRGEPEAGEFAGTTVIGPNWDRRTATFGIWLRKPFWGRGYSGERAAALMEVAFERLDLEVVAVSHHPDNANSRRAIEKYVERWGGQHEGLLRNGAPGTDGPVDLHRYTVTREQWRDAKKGNR